MGQAPEQAHRDRLHACLADVDALMSQAVYDALFDAAADQGPRQVLEIGTAHGAGTIAMALGSVAAGHETRIQTVDTLQALPDIPSSRARFGNAAENERIVLGNFEKAGVADRIDLFVGRSDEFAAALPKDFQVDMLVLDADGRIDRDLALFGHCLAKDCLVVVDDIDGKVAAAIKGGALSIDLKHVISEKLASKLVDAGYLKFEKRVVDTSFFRALAPQDWDSAKIASIAIESYRELVFLKAPMSSVFASTMASFISSTALLRPLYGSARTLYHRLTGRHRQS